MTRLAPGEPVTPELAGWRYLSFAVHALTAPMEVGGDVIITLPAAWQRRFNASPVDVRRRIKELVDPSYVAELRRMPDFVAAYEPDGLAVADFDAWGPSVKTLRTFIGSYHELLHLVGEALLA